jgi:hypothetical protein
MTGTTRDVFKLGAPQKDVTPLLIAVILSLNRGRKNSEDTHEME